MAPVSHHDSTKRRSADGDLAPVASAPTKTPGARSVPTQAAAVKTNSGRGRPAAVTAPEAAPTRVPPPSKGELRAQIERLETANATLKAKSREGNRAAKAAARRITELEEQVAQLQEEAARVVDPAAVMEELEAAKAALQAKGREASRCRKAGGAPDCGTGGSSRAPAGTGSQDGSSCRLRGRGKATPARAPARAQERDQSRRRRAPRGSRFRTRTDGSGGRSSARCPGRKSVRSAGCKKTSRKEASGAFTEETSSAGRRPEVVSDGGFALHLGHLAQPGGFPEADTAICNITSSLLHI